MHDIINFVRHKFNVLIVDRLGYLPMTSQARFNLFSVLTQKSSESADRTGVARQAILKILEA